MGKYRWGVIGFDETAIDDFPAIYTAVASNLVEDGRVRKRGDPKDTLSKKNVARTKVNAPPEFIKNVEYSWLQFEKSDKNRIQPYYRWGAIIGSLLHGEEMQNPLTIYIDGRINDTIRTHTRDCISEITRLPKDYITVQGGVDYDKRVRVVNYAHHLAFHLKHRSWTLDDLAKDTHQKSILDKLIVQFEDKNSKKRERRSSGRGRKRRN